MQDEFAMKEMDIYSAYMPSKQGGRETRCYGINLVL